MDLVNMAGSGFDQIALPAAGGDEFAPQFPPKVEDVHVEQIGQGILVLVEEVLVELGAADGSSRWSARYSRIAYSRAVSVSGSPCRSARRARVSMTTSPNSIWAAPVPRRAESAPGAGQQFHQVEGFDHIIIRAGVEAAHGSGANRER